MKKEELLLSDHELNRVGKALRPYLDAGTQNIKPGIAYRLAEARRAAIASLDAEAASSTSMAGGTLAMAGGWRTRINDWRFWATGLIVAGVLSTYGVQQWNEFVTARDTADVDVMLLADDVPVDALLDKGFSHFLREDQ
jgi:Protein of unknown function (DUF3619)